MKGLLVNLNDGLLNVRLDALRLSLMRCVSLGWREDDGRIVCGRRCGMAPLDYDGDAERDCTTYQGKGDEMMR